MLLIGIVKNIASYITHYHIVVGVLPSQGVGISALVAGSSAANGVCLVQLSAIPADTSALAHKAMVMCQYFSL